MEMNLDDFLQAITDNPHDAATTWAVMADWLEEQGDPRWEFVRLMYQRDYHGGMPPEDRDERVRQLLASGMQPIAPTIINSVGMQFVLIPAGTFLMGSPEEEGDDDEHPQHEVEITRPFCMGAFPVTQEQYQRVMGKNPSYYSAAGSGKDSVEGMDTTLFPVETVSWYDAMKFCEALGLLPEEKKGGCIYRLPTEAEWEYACRGGASSYARYHFGPFLSSNLANFGYSSLNRPCPVGCYPANAFGLFDMHGNVWEWCLDWFQENYYVYSPKRDPQGADSEQRRVLRGGAWSDIFDRCRSADRGRTAPGDRLRNYGFRVTFRLG
jgi:uncharacterized protein (TIGR02996 family)